MHASVPTVIVVGAPRSGTTFVMAALDAVRGVECVSGILAPVGIAHLGAQRLGGEIDEVLARSMRLGADEYLRSGLFLARSAALRKWWAADRGVMGLGRATRGVRDVNLLVYKENFWSFAPALLRMAWPDAKIVHLYRDGRDVADSLVRSYDVLSDERLRSLEHSEGVVGTEYRNCWVPWWVPKRDMDEFVERRPFVRAMMMWREMLRRCVCALGAVDDSRDDEILHVRYEDLVAEPRAYGRTIADHVGVRLTARAYKRLDRAHTRSVGVHRTRSDSEVQAATVIAQEELRACGYA